MPQLLIQNGDQAPLAFELNGDLVSIGRSAENTIVLDHDSVSSRHAQIRQENGGYVLRDLGSSNGSTVNGVVVTEVQLNDGDQIKIGGVPVSFLSMEGKPVDAHPLDVDLGRAFSMDDGGELGIAKTLSVFKTLDYGFLLPFKKIFAQGLLKKRAVRWVMIFGLLPICIFVAAVKLDLDFKQTVWLLEGYFCLFWALYFHTLIQPGNSIWRRAIACSVITVVIGIPVVLHAQEFPLINKLYEATESDNFIGRVFGYVLGVGPLEEIVKALPLLFFAFVRNRMHSVREGLFLGFMSGLGFAAAEGVAYSFGAAMMASRAGFEGAFTAQILLTIFRFMTGPLLHGAWAGIAGWFIGLAANRPAPRWPVVCVGIGFVSLLHGINDVFAGSILHVVVAGLSILILMAYLNHGAESSAVDAAAGTPLPANAE